MLDGRNAQDAGIIGGEIARHIQLIVEARLLSLEPNAQREKAKVGGLGTVTLLRRENNPGTRNLAEPDGKPSKRQEELGIRIEPALVAERMVVLGLIHDLLRLKPDIVVRLDLSPAEVPAQLEAVSEFSELALVRTDRSALAAFWEAHDPGALTPAAAGAIALFEALSQV